MKSRLSTKRINLGEGGKALAHNRCSNCGHEWMDKPFGLAQHMTCLKCGSEYWEWLNYGKAAD